MAEGRKEKAKTKFEESRKAEEDQLVTSQVMRDTLKDLEMHLL